MSSCFTIKYGRTRWNTYPPSMASRNQYQKFPAVGIKFFYANRWTDGQIWRRLNSLFVQLMHTNYIKFVNY
jgi:hypothetical protein